MKNNKHNKYRQYCKYYVFIKKLFKQNIKWYNTKCRINQNLGLSYCFKSGFMCDSLISQNEFFYSFYGSEEVIVYSNTRLKVILNIK